MRRARDGHAAVAEALLERSPLTLLLSARRRSSRRRGGGACELHPRCYGEKDGEFLALRGLIARRWAAAIARRRCV